MLGGFMRFFPCLGALMLLSFSCYAAQADRGPFPVSAIQSSTSTLDIEAGYRFFIIRTSVSGQLPCGLEIVANDPTEAINLEELASRLQVSEHPDDGSSDVPILPLIQKQRIVYLLSHKQLEVPTEFIFRTVDGMGTIDDLVRLLTRKGFEIQVTQDVLYVNSSKCALNPE